MPYCLNSLAPGRYGCHSKDGIFNLVLLIGIFRSSHDNALWWMPQDLTDDKSTLVQVMASCRQATSHYLSQCWLRTLWPYGVARPQWVKWNYQQNVCSETFWYIFRKWWIKWNWWSPCCLWLKMHLLDNIRLLVLAVQTSTFQKLLI